MAKDKKGFILYADQKELFEQLSDEKAGQLIKHILKYVNDENPTSDDLIINLAFTPIKQQLKRDLIKFENKKKKASGAGVLGNLKRWHKDLYDKVVKEEIDINEALSIADNRKVSQPDKTSSQSIANIAVNDTVTVNDTVNDNDKVIVKDNKKNIEERKADFKKSLTPFLEGYGKELLIDFFEYWTEHGENDKKMRYEKEKSFGIKRRLSTWINNEKKWKKEKSSAKKEKRFIEDKVFGDEKAERIRRAFEQEQEMRRGGDNILKIG